MIKKFRVVTMLTVLCLAGASCQKEQIVEPTNMLENAEAVYTVTYSVDGVQYTTTVFGDQALNELLSYLLDLAHEGRTVIIQSGNTLTIGLTKDTVTYTTRDKDDAQAWCAQKVKEGYSVTMQEDPTGLFICTATK